MMFVTLLGKPQHITASLQMDIAPCRLCIRSVSIHFKSVIIFQIHWAGETVLLANNININIHNTYLVYICVPFHKSVMK